jgi:hypothetical protein
MFQFIFPGSAIRKGILEACKIEQAEIALSKEINISQISKEINGEHAKGDRVRVAIYQFLPAKVRRAVSFEDFWCVNKNLKDVEV